MNIHYIINSEATYNSSTFQQIPDAVSSDEAIAYEKKCLVSAEVHD
jgi:hypothetical protein